MQAFVRQRRNEPVSGWTFIKKTPIGEAGLRTLHQVGVLLPPIALLKRIFWTSEPAVMALHVDPLSFEVFSKVKPTQLSCALQRFSAAITVKFAAPCDNASRQHHTPYRVSTNRERIAEWQAGTTFITCIAIVQPHCTFARN